MAHTNDGLSGEPRATDLCDLDCTVCGRWFRSFDHLAKHMYARHGPPTPGNQIHDAWAKHSGIAEHVESIHVELPAPKGNAMSKLPAPRGNGGAPARGKKKSKNTPTRTRRGGIPVPKQSDRDSEYNPFLKAADIGDLDETAVLTLTGKVRVADSGFGEQMICEVRYDGRLYDWPFKIDGANHRILYKRFGKDERKWRGKVNVTIKEFNGNPYVAADRA